MRLGELARRCGGRLVGEGLEGVEFRGFATDSREVGAGDVFLAIRGAHLDGHEFAGVAYERGAVAVLGEREVGGPAVVVEDLVAGLARFGGSLRAEFEGPVVGITGSNGKTTTKELLAAALGARGRVLKSAGNRNTEYTSPLVWHEAMGGEWAAVVEMGMRGFGQIAHLASVARPTVGVITMIGTAHLEMVGSRAGIAEAKGEIFAALPLDGVAVAWAEDDFIGDLRRRAGGRRLVTFGFSPEADLRVVGYRPEGWGASVVRFAWRGAEAEGRVGALGRHQALNAAAAVLAAVECGVDFRSAVGALSGADLPPMRMEVRELRGATVLVDTYNASPDSTVAALRALGEGPCGGRRIAVLGEMRELGVYTEGGHRAVGRALGMSAVDVAVLTGGPTRFMESEALAGGYPSERMVVFAELDLAGLRAWLEREVRAGDVVLVKGSRALGLERALEGLV